MHDLREKRDCGISVQRNKQRTVSMAASLASVELVSECFTLAACLNLNLLAWAPSNPTSLPFVIFRDFLFSVWPSWFNCSVKSSLVSLSLRLVISSWAILESLGSFSFSLSFGLTSPNAIFACKDIPIQVFRSHEWFALGCWIRRI